MSLNLMEKTDRKIMGRFVGLIKLVIVISVFMSGNCFSDDLKLYRGAAFSDDARTVEEAKEHWEARDLVISKIESNKLGVTGSRFRVKRDPSGLGCFVYDPKTRFYGVQRNIVWWVSKDGKAYTTNSPSMMVTPGLNRVSYAKAEGFKAPATPGIVGYVFRGEPIDSDDMSARISVPDAPYTMKEYKIYRLFMDSPMSEDMVTQHIGRTYGLPEKELHVFIDRVTNYFITHNLFGSPEMQIKFASDWEGE